MRIQDEYPWCEFRANFQVEWLLKPIWGRWKVNEKFKWPVVSWTGRSHQYGSPSAVNRWPSNGGLVIADRHHCGQQRVNSVVSALTTVAEQLDISGVFIHQNSVWIANCVIAERRIVWCRAEWALYQFAICAQSGRSNGFPQIMTVRISDELEAKLIHL